MRFGYNKRFTVQSQLGLCRDMRKRCGLEAICIQLNASSYTCICLQGSMHTTFDFNQLKCFPKEQTTLNPLNRDPNQPINQTTLISRAVIVMIVAVMIILVMYLSLSLKNYCKKLQKNGQRKSPELPMTQTNWSVDNSKLYGLSSISPVTEDTAPFMYVDNSCVSLVQEIGQGFFAKVYKGELRHNSGKLETVAIKTLKDDASGEAKSDFRREIETMKYFRHPKILALIGICSKGSVSYPWMIFEYMEFGDLTNVLRNSNDRLSTCSSNLPILGKDALFGISLQIAAGMEYLASQRFIHRDLACRNCLVGHDLSIKISDFGMSRDVYMSDYYQINSTRFLPLRWMSPECIMYKRYTEKSDVWSFGVVLWEIYTLGKQPYYEYSNVQLLKFIPDGGLLKIPMDCPQVIYELMTECWKFFPKDRLRFVDIHERLKNATKELELNNTLPNKPSLKDIINHPIVKKIRAKEVLDDENYLKPIEPQNNAEI